MKKYLFLPFIALLAINGVFAVPASPTPFTVTQPDGTQLTLHSVGDEYYHWVETEDNQIVVQSDAGYYEYATIRNNEVVASGIKAGNMQHRSSVQTGNLSDRNEMLKLMSDKRAAIMAQIRAMEQAEEQAETSNINSETIQATSSQTSLTIGSQKVLCILIGFPDRPFVKTRADFEAMWNGTNYHEEGSQGSVREFYEENSYHNMTVRATVVGPYVAKHNSSYYATNGNDIASSKVRELAKEAIKFKNFDANGDKYVDAVHIVFAGYAADAYESTGLIWSHHSSLSSAVLQGLYKAKEYFMTSELAEGSGSKIAPIGTVCHEYGHALGAPDYYDLNHIFSGTGRWDVMANGGWNGRNGGGSRNGRCPAHHNPYTKAYIYKWIIPAVITSTVKNTLYEMTPSHNSTSFYRINTSTANEFFLIENKAKISDSFNADIPKNGLLIYHIHSDIQNSIASNTINTSHPQRCYVVCANASSDPTSSPSSYGCNLGYSCAFPTDNNSKIFFTSTSTPSAKSWGGVATGVDLCFIQRNGNNIKFVVNPEINGKKTLSTPDTYSVAHIPVGAKIKWTYTFTPSSPSHRPPLGRPIIFVNGDSTALVTLKRGTYTIWRDTLAFLTAHASDGNENSPNT